MSGISRCRTRISILDSSPGGIILCLFLFLNSLMDKKFIESVGFVRAGKTYARTFQPVLSRPEFYAQLVNAALTDKELVAFKRALKALNKVDDEAEN